MVAGPQRGTTVRVAEKGLGGIRSQGGICRETGTRCRPDRLRQTAQPGRKGAERPLTERLATLNDLKDKGLITEDEYKAKRREIMNEKEPERTPAERLATLNELKGKG